MSLCNTVRDGVRWASTNGLGRTAMAIAESDLLAPDLEKHRGEWVAIKDGKVVASGKNASDVVRQLREQEIVDAALHRVAESPDTAFVL